MYFSRDKLECMQTVLASTLSNTRVLSTDGQELGTLDNFTVDTASGKLEEIILETDKKELFGRERDRDGCIRLPASLIESMRDHLVIRPPEEFLK